MARENSEKARHHARWHDQCPRDAREQVKKEETTKIAKGDSLATLDENRDSTTSVGAEFFELALAFVVRNVGFVVVS